MTPQEAQLVDELFDRLAKLETAPRDPDAERVIAGGAQRAPHAVYALVQTVLLQDEALKRANAHIEELQAELDGGAQPPAQQQGSFLDSMRAAFSPRDPRGSVPSVRPPAPGYQSQPGYPPQMPEPGYGAGPAFGSGGSFLGTAASAAAGMIGGSLLLDGIRSMFGHQAGGHERASPWLGGAGSAADSRLAAEDRRADARQDAEDDARQDAQDDAQQDAMDDFGDDGEFSDDA